MDWFSFFAGWTACGVTLLIGISLIQKDHDTAVRPFDKGNVHDSKYLKITHDNPEVAWAPAPQIDIYKTCTGKMPSSYNWKFLWDDTVIESYSDFYQVRKKEEPLMNFTLDFPAYFEMNSKILARSINKLDTSVSVERLDAKRTRTDVKILQKRMHAIISQLKRNPSSKSNLVLKQELYAGVFDIALALQSTRIATFERVFVNNMGLIIDPITCQHVLNAGCLFGGKKKFAMFGSPKEYQTVVYLSGVSGAAGSIWHFPMECLVALSFIKREITETTFIYVNQKSKLSLEWLSLLHIPKTRVIDDHTAFVHNLIVPEQGRCARPSYSQLTWFVKQFETYRIPAEKRKRRVLFMKRTTRTMKNEGEVEKALVRFCKNNGYELKIHDDKHLPSLLDQIKMFLNSDIVVGPHGAGLTFIAFLPKNSCVVEIMPDLPDLGFICYPRLGFLQHLNYWQILLNSKWSVDLKAVVTALHQCNSTRH